MAERLIEARSIFFKPIQSLIFISVVFLSIFLLTTQYYLYALLPGLILLFLLLFSRYPQIVYYMIIFSIPFWAYRGLSETYKFLKIHWLLGFVLIIFIAFLFVFRKIDFLNFRSNLWPWFGILFVISLFSAFGSAYPEISYKNIFLLIVAYMFFAMNLLFLSREGFSKTLPRILILSVSLSACLGIIGYVFNIPFFVETVDTYYKRSIGGSLDPNNLSLMIIFTLPILVHWFSTSKRLVGKLFIILLFCINISGIIVTYSRGGALILSITLLLLIVVYAKKIKLRYLGFVALLVTILLFAVLSLIPSSYWERQKSAVDVQEDRAVARRISYLYVGWEAFKEHPIIGAGPGTFKEIYAGTYYALQFKRKEEEELTRHAHNTYLEHLVGTGIVGLTIFLIILWRALKNFHLAKKNYQLSGEKEMVSLISAYQISFISLIFYLFIFSEMYHKFLIVGLALSQVACNLSQERTAIPDGSIVLHH